MFSYRIFLSAAVVVLAVTSIPVRRDVDDSLVPEFGVTAGIPDPAGSASCINNSTGVLIPCACPMSRDSFIAELNKNVAAGMVVNNPSVAVSFPEDDSVTSQLTRLQACLVTLQNFNGSGVGCPVAATDWVALQEEIESDGSTSASSAASPSSSASSPTSSASSPTSSASSLTSSASSSASSTSLSATVASSSNTNSTATATGAVAIAVSSNASVTATSTSTAASATATGNGTIDASLVPDFGITADTDPTGTGDCTGANGVEIPCICPPDRDEFIGNLTLNVQAGKVINNPSVAVSFPLDNSTQSQLTRLGACLVTLQNQRGTGVGCPAAATTWVALQKSLQAQL
ncbi:hypothetical protein DAEQUDRAFT_765257 [Daedalea quercina L-15889]|uniref:Uncharacterized protein n=1 Tax=Daedalea quercina L-15889 TaxID=1314783 RepID=A0A165QMC6_9APHY|nr:hypothetical protein DAEQUDRAFT_765257 [Daedalea quercina L-15889]